MLAPVTLIGPNGYPYTTPGFSSNVPALYDHSSLYGLKQAEGSDTIVTFGALLGVGFLVGYFFGKGAKK